MTQIARPLPEAAADDAMQTLTVQWYNTLVAALNLDANSFQLVQAAQPLGTTSTSLWQYFDSVPPLSLNQVFSSSRFNSVYQNYRAVVNTIVPQQGSQWADVMGDGLAAWNTYKKEKVTADLLKSNGGLVGVFDEWADLNLDDARAGQAKTLFRQLRNGVVTLAVNAVNDPAYVDTSGVPKFDVTIDDLRAALTHAPAQRVTFDSATASKDGSHTWAHGEVSGSYEFFRANAGGQFDQINSKTSGARVTVEVSFDRYLSFAARPSLWFSSAALNLAYANRDNTVWPAGQHPDWNDTFGEHGNLRRFAAELVVVDGLTATITSEATYASDERRLIEASASAGVWPFFSASGEGGHSTAVTFDDAGRMTVTVTTPKGNPAVLGVNVLPIDRLVTLTRAEDPTAPLVTYLVGPGGSKGWATDPIPTSLTVVNPATNRGNGRYRVKVGTRTYEESLRPGTGHTYHNFIRQACSVRNIGDVPLEVTIPGPGAGADVEV